MSRVLPPPSSGRRRISPSPRSRRASWLRSRARAISVSAMTDWTVETLVHAIATRKISPVEATRECLNRIERLDGKIHAFITVDADGALAAARALEAELAAGLSRGPLHGVPLAYKDLCHVPGLPTSCGTRTRDYFMSPIECTAVARLRAAGAVDRKSTRLNSSHGSISYPIFCLKKKIREQLRRFARIYLGSWLVTPELVRVLVREVARSPEVGRRVGEIIYFFMVRRRMSSTLFPYTTLFR